MYDCPRKHTRSNALIARILPRHVLAKQRVSFGWNRAAIRYEQLASESTKYTLLYISALLVADVLYKLIDMSWSYGVRLASDEEAEVIVVAAVALVGDCRGVDVVGRWDVGLSKVEFQWLLSVPSPPSSDTIEISAIIPLSASQWTRWRREAEGMDFACQSSTSVFFILANNVLSSYRYIGGSTYQRCTGCWEWCYDDEDEDSCPDQGSTSWEDHCFHHYSTMNWRRLRCAASCCSDPSPLTWILLSSS